MLTSSDVHQTQCASDLVLGQPDASVQIDLLGSDEFYDDGGLVGVL